jgi:thymidylate kinase
MYDLIIYLRLDPTLRMERLRQRERIRYGQRIEPGGDMAALNAQFLTWAAAYDTAGREQRSHQAHEEWLAAQAAPVLRLDSSEPVQTLVQAVLSAVRTTE